LANPRHVCQLLAGVQVWNRWRADNPATIPDLTGLSVERHRNLAEADLTKAKLTGADLNGADLRKACLNDASLKCASLVETRLDGACLQRADLRSSRLNRARLQQADLSEAKLDKSVLLGASLFEANLRHARLINAILDDANLEQSDLSDACLTRADLTHTKLMSAILDRTHLLRAGLSNADLTGIMLRGANLTRADLRGAKLDRADFTDAILVQARLSEASLRGTVLRRADLRDADLEASILLGCDLEGATLRNCRIFGTSVWSSKLEGAIQADLVITPREQVTITVDSLELGQFIYSLLDNERIHDVFDVISGKTVLILGRFVPERKIILDTIREQLRPLGYVPVMFDFKKARSQTTTQTVVTLAGMAFFVIADITHPVSAPQELEAIVPRFPLVPVQPIIAAGNKPWGMYDGIRRGEPQVLPVFEYKDLQDLVTSFESHVVKPAAHLRRKMNRMD
jgi:uncharacterized protein YjbI with pentapeptide repeats